MLANGPALNPGSPPDVPAVIAEARERLRSAGREADELVACVEHVDYPADTHEPLRRIMDAAGIPLEQLALYETALRYRGAVAGLPVAAPVRELLESEFARILSGEAGPRSTGEAGSATFAATCRIVTLRRMPAGPMDWDVSGFPRSWLLRVPPGKLPATVWFLLTRMRGLRPYFHLHVARKPKNRALVIEREVLKTYWRIARSMALQPAIRGLMATSWFHDVSAIPAYPHLAWLNLPYLEEGGFITDIGEAPIDSGFADNNPKRRELAERGELKFRLGVALWPREAMVAWAARHPELGE